LSRLVKVEFCENDQGSHFKIKIYKSRGFLFSCKKYPTDI